MGDEKQTWTDQEWVEAFAQDAMLIKRPLIVKDETAVLVGFRAKDEEIRDRLDI